MALSAATVKSIGWTGVLAWAAIETGEAATLSTAIAFGAVPMAAESMRAEMIFMSICKA